MSLSRAEAEQLRALASAMRAFATSPKAVAGFAVVIEAFAEERSGSRRIVVEERQVALFDDGAAPSTPEQHIRSSEESEHSTCATPNEAADSTSRTYPVESDSSPAPITESNRRQQKGRFTVCLDSPFADEYSRVFAQVKAARAGVKLPPGEYVWGKFCEWIVDEEKTFSRRWNIRRAFRQFAEKERAIVEAPVAAGSERRVRATQPPPRTAPQKPRPAHRPDQELAELLGATTSSLAKAGAIRAAPEPRSASA